MSTSSPAPIVSPLTPPGMRVATWGPAVLLVFDGPLARDSIALIERTIQRHDVEHPRRVIVASALDTRGLVPDVETRREIAERLARVADKVRAVGWVIEGDPFRRAAAQAVLIGMRMLARRSHLPPLKVAGSSAEAFAWFASRPELGVHDAAAGAAALEQLRHGAGAAASSGTRAAVR